MKTATLPAIRVTPALRDQLEQVLNEGESLSAFVEASVRSAVKQRMDQAAFVARGMASLAAAQRTGQFVSAQVVVSGLQDQLADAKRRLKQKQAAAPT